VTSGGSARRCSSITLSAFVLVTSPPAGAAPGEGEVGAHQPEVQPKAAPTSDAATSGGGELEPNAWLPGVEIALGLTLGGLEYWVRNHPPRLGLSSWVDRFSSTEWLVLDEDPFVFNYSYHALAGAGYHLAARTSDLGMVEAILYSLASSLIWEYVIEYDRSVDLNDLLFTSPAGLALGEFGHALGRLLQQTSSGRGRPLARWTLGLPQSFQDELRGADGPRGPEVAHRFRLSVGASRARGTTTHADASEGEDRVHGQVRVRGHLARIDELDRHGRRWRSFADGNFTSVDAALVAGADRYEGVCVLSDTFLAGWRFTDVDEYRARGRALNLGSAAAFRYQREQRGAWRDRLAAAHLPGLAADLALWGPRWRLDSVARAHPDYGGIGALSHRRWVIENPTEIGWSSLEEEGYYHALGLSGRLHLELTLPAVRAGAEIFAGRYRNHRGRDLRDAELTLKQRIASRTAEYGLWMSGSLSEAWFLEARFEGRHRWERYEELSAMARSLRVGLELGTTF
jgi:hypothetical protein